MDLFVNHLAVLLFLHDFISGMQDSSTLDENQGPDHFFAEIFDLLNYTELSAVTFVGVLSVIAGNLKS